MANNRFAEISFDAILQRVAFLQSRPPCFDHDRRILVISIFSEGIPLVSAARNDQSRAAESPTAQDQDDSMSCFSTRFLFEPV
jgi:hypothetical protein